MKNIKKFLKFCDGWVLENDDIKTIKSMMNRYAKEHLKCDDYYLIFQGFETRKQYDEFLQKCNDYINDDNDLTLLLDLLLSKPSYSKFNKIVDQYDFGFSNGGMLAYACKSKISLKECYEIVKKELSK